MKYEAHFTPAKKEMLQSNYPKVSGQCEARHGSVVFSGFSGKFQGNLTKHHSQSSCIFSGFRNEFHLDHRTCHQMNLVVQKLRFHNLKFLRYL